MNCCDYDCHQGRDCPARKQPYPFTDITPMTPEAPDEPDSVLMYLISIVVAYTASIFTAGFLAGYAAQKLFP